MRNIVMAALSLFGIWVLITGITDSDLHTVAVLLLTAILCIHIWYNRKIAIQHLKGLGWKWIVIGLILVVMMTTTVFDLASDTDWQRAEEDCTD
jgi:hypothetical protein